MIIDMWYGDNYKDCDKIDITFYPNGGGYRGNIYKNNKCIGDYIAESSQKLEHKFNHLVLIGNKNII